DGNKQEDKSTKRHQVLKRKHAHHLLKTEGRPPQAELYKFYYITKISINLLLAFFYFIVPCLNSFILQLRVTQYRRPATAMRRTAPTGGHPSNFTAHKNKLSPLIQRSSIIPTVLFNNFQTRTIDPFPDSTFIKLSQPNPVSIFFDSPIVFVQPIDELRK